MREKRIILMRNFTSKELAGEKVASIYTSFIFITAVSLALFGDEQSFSYAFNLVSECMCYATIQNLWPNGMI